MAHLSVALLGTPRVECNGAPIAVDTRQAIALHAYLEVTGEPQGRDALAALLWPPPAPTTIPSPSPATAAWRPLTRRRRSTGPTAGEPTWWLNFRADPNARVTLKDGARPVRARAAEGEERRPPGRDLEPAELGARG
jgi:hypothetical protein